MSQVAKVRVHLKATRRPPRRADVKPLAMELILKALLTGQARFEPATKEFCFGGMRYCAGGEDWETLADVIGWRKLLDAATAGGQRA